MIELKIHVFPGNEIFSCNFEDNKSFKDLKNGLIKRQIINKDNYYIEMNNNYMNDDILLKDNGMTNSRDINVVRNDYIKFKVEIKDFWFDRIQTIQRYILISDFKVIKANGNKEI